MNVYTGRAPALVRAGVLAFWFVVQSGVREEVSHESGPWNTLSACRMAREVHLTEVMGPVGVETSECYQREES